MQAAWELVLALLPPQEIACCAETCRLLAEAARNVTSRRCSDACQGNEPNPVPFVSPAVVPAGASWTSPGAGPPRYAYFQYARTNIRRIPSPFSWGRPSPDGEKSLATRSVGLESRSNELKEFNGIPADVIHALGAAGCLCPGPTCRASADGPCSCGLTGEGTPAYTFRRAKGALSTASGHPAREGTVAPLSPRAKGVPSHSDAVTREGTPGRLRVGLLLWAQERVESGTTACRQGAAGKSEGAPESTTGSLLHRGETSSGSPCEPGPKRRRDCEGRKEGDCADSKSSSRGGPLPGPLLFECGPACACGPSCPHRLSQQPLQWPLEVRWDGTKGWGLFAAGHIPAGAFLCQYAGEVLTSQASRIRQRKRDSVAAACRAAGERPPPSFLMAVNEHLPSQRASLRTNIDPTAVGSLGRFMNHRCDGGTVVQCILRYTGCPLPGVGLFAARDIGPGEELTFSYGEAEGEGAQGADSVCHCGSLNCSGTLPTCAP